MIASKRDALLNHQNSTYCSAVLLGLPSTTLEWVPGEDGAVVLSAGFSTHLGLLADSLPSSRVLRNASGHIASSFDQATSTHERACEAAKDLKEEKDYKAAVRLADLALEKNKQKIRTSAAKSLLLRHLLHSVFGLSHSPNLNKVRQEIGMGASSSSSSASGPAPGLTAAEAVAIPQFLQVELRTKEGAGAGRVELLWRRSWGLSDLHSLTLRNKPMLDLMRWVCSDFELGHMKMFCNKEAAEWARERRTAAGVSTLDSSPAHNPQNSREWMARCAKLVIPHGLVAEVCTPTQQQRASEQGGCYILENVAARQSKAAMGHALFGRLNTKRQSEQLGGHASKRQSILLAAKQGSSMGAVGGEGELGGAALAEEDGCMGSAVGRGVEAQEGGAAGEGGKDGGAAVAAAEPPHQR